MLNAFLLISTTIIFEKAFRDRKSIRKLIIILAENVMIAALAELKLYYVEVIIVFAMIFILNKPSFKSVAIAGLGGVLLYVGIIALYHYNPYYVNTMNFNGLVESFDLAYVDHGLSRGRAVGYITSTFLREPIQKYFGIGFGNAIGSSINFLSSSFYNKYSSLNYNFFAHAYKLLETGWIGIISFMGYWLSPLLCFKCNASAENKVIGRTISACTLLLFVYNTSLMNLHIMFVLTYFCSIIYVEDSRNTIIKNPK